MNAPSTDPASLDHLRDIVLPVPVPLLPPAPGWYFLAAFLFAGVVVVGWRLARRWHRDRYRRAALAELERIADASRTAEDPVVAVRALPGLLKRAALAGFPREEVASLSGDAWLRFLDHTAGTTDFTRGPGRALESLAYRTEACATLDQTHIRQLLEAGRRWLRAHRAPGSLRNAHGGRKIR